MKVKKYLICLVTIILVMIYLSGCKSVKSSRKKETEKETHLVQEARELESLTIEHFDEELSGFIPLPGVVSLSPSKGVEGRAQSVTVPIESKGMSLSFTVSDSGISYQAQVKPVARSSLKKETEATTKTEVKEVVKEQAKETQKPVGINLPWWMWLVLIAAAVLALLRVLKVISNPFKIFFK